MSFGNPWLLHALWAVPAMALLIFWRLRRRRKRLEHIASETAIPRLIPRWHPSVERMRNLVWLLGLSAGIFALAQPRWGFEWQDVSKHGLDVMLVLDTSNSMLAADLPENRLAAAKRGIIDFVRTLNGDRVGLVAFAGQSFLQCPLTADYAAFRMTLNDMFAGIIQQGGTDIGGAMAEAMKHFDEESAADRVIILITDGEDHEDRLGTVIGDLNERQIKVYCVGVGSKTGEPVLIEKGGRREYLKDRQGNIVTSRLNDVPLKSLAAGTGGFYVNAIPGNFGLETIYEQGISKLKGDDRHESRVKVHYERFAWFLGLGLLLFAFECLIPAARARETRAGLRDESVAG